MRAATPQNPDVAILTAIHYGKSNVGLNFVEFRTKSGVIAANILDGAKISHTLLGQPFSLEMMDTFYLKEIKPAVGEAPPSGFHRYRLNQVNRTLKQAIFSNDQGDIQTSYEALDLNPSQTGKLFDLDVVPEFYASHAKPRLAVSPGST